MAVRYDIAASGLPGNYRGTPPRAGGTGSGAGPAYADHAPAVRNRWRRRGGSNGGAWSPTVLNLLVLIAVEIGIYIGLRMLFKTAHGG